MKCQNCGEELREAANFCPKCGHEVLPEAPFDEQSNAHADDASSDGEHDETEDVSSPSDRVDAPATPSDRRKRLLIGLLVITVIASLGYTVATRVLDDGTPDIAFSLEEIKDDAFRSYLRENVDADDDGAISQDEADALRSIGGVDDAGNVTDAGLSGCGVESLDGIEYFGNLTTLICDSNALTALDLSENSKLTYLSCNDNALSELTLPIFSPLVVLHATHNQLTTIDLSMQIELRDVELDASVVIRGTEGPSDETARAKIEDLALVFAFARGLGYGSGEDSGNLVVGPGVSADTDNMLIEAVVSSTLFPSRNLTYVLEYLSDMSYDAAGMVSVPRAQGEAIIRSVYGDVPSDLNYLFAANGLVTYLGDEGWYVFPAQGATSFDIASDHWQGCGRLVSFDADILVGDGPDMLNAAEQTYRVTVVEDEKSVFGYHLVSMASIDAAQDEVVSGADEKNESNTDSDSDSDEVVDSIVSWAESERGGSSSSSTESSNGSGSVGEAKSWPNFDQLPGTWVGTLTETEHNSVGGQAACYGGRTQPLVVTFKSVDAAMGTAVVDIRALVHSHDVLANAAEQTEGDRYVELTDVLVTLRKNSNATYQVYEGKDLGPYHINFCFSEDGSFVAEVYTEAKVTNPFVAWRRDTFDMKKQ